MRRPMPSSRQSERGAVIIQIAICLLFLLAFASFVVDYGFMWTGRAQAQTSADAAALAGANSMAYDNTTVANIKARARAVGRANYVWNQAPDMLDTDIEIINCPPTPGLPNDDCIRARAFRNQARNNPLPTFFANLVGVRNQGVQALAVARAVSANGTNCLRPWAVADKWFDTQPGGWSQSATWDPPGDIYTPPTATDYGTGFSARDANNVPTYYGYQMVLKIDNPGQGGGAQQPVYSGGWAMELDLDNPTANGGNNEYIANINGCTSQTVGISAPGSDCTVVDTPSGCLPVKTGSGGATNERAIDDFIATHDPSATWTNGSGATGWQTGTINSTQSPSSRIVPVAIFDMPQYIGHGYNGQNGIVRVVNIVGFFVEGSCSDNNFTKESYLQCPTGGSAQGAIVGRLVNYPGIYTTSGSSVAGSFGQVIVLVR